MAGHRTRCFGCDAGLEWINTAAALRRQGIARHLLLRMADWFVQQQAFRVCVDVTPDNAPARALYRAYGAEPLNDLFLMRPDIRQIISPSPDGSAAYNPASAGA